MKTMAVLILLALFCLSIYPDPTLSEVSLKRPSRYSRESNENFQGKQSLDEDLCKYLVKIVARMFACLLPHQSIEGRKVRYGSGPYESIPWSELLGKFHKAFSPKEFPMPWWLFQEDTQDAVTDEGTCAAVFKYFAKRS